jgi:hypothetical protein
VIAMTAGTTIAVRGNPGEIASAQRLRGAALHAQPAFIALVRSTNAAKILEEGEHQCTGKAIW